MELLRIDVRKNSLYVAFLIPEVGLHLSLHGIDNNAPQIHVKSGNKGNKDDLPTFCKGITPIEDLYKTPRGWLEDFGKFIYYPKHRQKILVIPTPPILDSKSWGFSLSSKGVIQINFLIAVMKYLDYLVDNFYFLEPEEFWNELPKLVKTGASLFDFTENKLIIINKARYPLLIGYKINQSFEDQIRHTKIWKNFLSPVKEAFDYVEEQYPGAIDEWSSTLEKDELDSVKNINTHLGKIESLMGLLAEEIVQNL